jgi:hypothetical protein
MTMANLSEAGGTMFGSSTWGPTGSFRGRNLLDSERYAVIERRLAYFDCTQHDRKKFDFDGRIYDAQGGRGISATQPLLSAEQYPDFVPLSRRRPSAPARLGRTIVQSFTSLLFGEERFPKFLAPSDPAAQDYMGALSVAQHLPRRMISARNYGGACGTVAMSWAFLRGKPVTAVHNPKNIHVASWMDRDELVPEHVIKCFQYSTLEWNPEKKKLETVWWWYRRDWTPYVDVVFQPVRVSKDLPVFIPDPTKIVQHDDGVCHFTWGQNLPSDEVDGEPDYEGVYDLLDQADITLSVVTRGANLNLDPTLVLKMDPDQVAVGGVKKGSGNGLTVGEAGDAKYLELAGAGILAGLELFKVIRKTTLEDAQCVIPDPDEATANGQSSVAMKALYRPMLGKGDVLREQYGSIIRRHLEPQLVIARRKSRSTMVVVEPDGSEKHYDEVLDLPPKIEKGPPTPEEPQGAMHEVERDPGHAESVDLDWGEWFPPTPQDASTYVTAIGNATGGKPSMSARTGSELVASFLGRDPDEERSRIEEETQHAADQQSAMFGGLPNASQGAKVTHTVPTPGGGTVKAQIGPPESSSSTESSESEPEKDDGTRGAIPLSPQAAMALSTVDEYRVSMGLSPLGGDDGSLSVAAFLAKYGEAIAKGANAITGKVGATPGAPPPAPKGPPGGGPPGHGPPGAPPGHPPGVLPPKPPGGGNPFGG